MSSVTERPTTLLRVQSSISGVAAKRSRSSSASDHDFDDQVLDFASSTEDLLHRVFGAGNVVGTIERPETRHSAALAWDVDLYAKSRPQAVARLGVAFNLCMDSDTTYLAVHRSSFVLRSASERSPLVRWDYDRRPRAKPASHIQVTAHRGAFSHVLALTGRRNPHSIESLHLPMGGERARVCLEDVIEFAVTDMHFNAEPDWRAAVLKGRERWRRIQTRTMVRDAPSEAVKALQSLGYSVQPPSDGPRADDIHRLQSW